MKYGDEFVKKNVINVDEYKRSSIYTQNILNYKLQKKLLSTTNETKENPDFKLFSVSSKINNSVIINNFIYSNSNGFLKLLHFISRTFIILLSITSIYACTIRNYSTKLEHIIRRLQKVDYNLLNYSQLDFEALMLSVQNLGCAGMERLGNPPSSKIASLSSSQRDNRSIRRPNKIPVTQHDLIYSNGEYQQQTSGIKYESYDSHNNSNVYTDCIANNNNCPTHITRHDGEFGRDVFLNHNKYNAEIKRNYIQAPPNRTVQDVPEPPINLQASVNMSKNLSYEKPSMNNSKSDKAKTGGIKGFIMKIIDNNSGNANSNSIKSGADFKTNSNLFAKCNMVQNFPTTSSSSSSSSSNLSLSSSSTTTTIKSDESIETLKSNASSTNSKHLSSGASSIQSSSSTLLDYNSL